MLAYPLDEAESMLDDKLNAAESSLRNCEEDLEFLREQITVSLFGCARHSGSCVLAFSLTFHSVHRHWRLPRRVCTIGMLYKDGKTRLMVRGMKRNIRSALVAEGVNLERIYHPVNVIEMSPMSLILKDLFSSCSSCAPVPACASIQ